MTHDIAEREIMFYHSSAWENAVLRVSGIFTNSNREIEKTA